MKKILALVLALALTLTAVVALAAPSPQGPGDKGKTGGNTGGDTGNVTPADETTDELAGVEVVDEKAAEEAIEAAKTATALTTVQKDSAESETVKEELKTAAQKDGDVLSVLPEKIQEELKEEKLTAVNEMVTVVIPKDAKNLTFKMSFQTLYKGGEKVKVLIAVPGKDGTVEWISVNGIATGKGEIVFTLDEATYNQIAGEEVVIVPASEPAK